MNISNVSAQQLLQLFTKNAGDSVSVGDTFTGRVLSLENGLLLMQLIDGSKISAEVKSDKTYTTGEVLKLEVIEAKQGQFFVKEVETAAVQSSEAETEKMNLPGKLLQSLDLPVDNNRLEVTRAILDMGVQPSAGLVEKSVSLLEGNEVSRPKEAVFLILNQMEGKEAYLPILKQFSEGTFQFQQKWEGLLGKIERSDENTIQNIAHEFQKQETIQKMNLSAAVKQLAGALTPADASIAIPKNPMAQTLETILLDLMEMPGAEGLEEKDIVLFLQKAVPEFSALPKNQQAEWVRVVKALWEQTQNIIAEKPETAEKAFESIEKSMKALPEKLTIQSSRASLPKVEEWMEDVEKKLILINKELSKTEGTESEKILSEVRELRTTLRFFQDITNYETFAQIPVVLKENSSQGELYVMKRKGSRGKIKVDDFSLLLSLETENLGVLDTFVQVRNKNVALRVRVEDERFYELLKNEYKPLYEALQEKGFHLYELKYALRDEGIDLFNAGKKALEMVLAQNKKIDIKV